MRHKKRTPVRERIQTTPRIQKCIVAERDVARRTDERNQAEAVPERVVFKKNISFPITYSLKSITICKL